MIHSNIAAILVTEFCYLTVNVLTAGRCFQSPQKCFTRSDFEMMTLTLTKGKQSHT